MAGNFPTRFAVVSAILALAACGDKVPEGSLVVPRGATISVRAIESIGATGAPFRASLESPLATGSNIFVSAGALVEGVAETTSGNSATEVELRLTRIHISDSSSVNIETEPMSRSVASAVTSDMVIEATMGLRDKICYLAEVEAAPGDSQSSDSGAIVPRGSQLVFTLSKKIVLIPSS